MKTKRKPKLVRDPSTGLVITEVVPRVTSRDVRKLLDAEGPASPPPVLMGRISTVDRLADWAEAEVARNAKKKTRDAKPSIANIIGQAGLREGRCLGSKTLYHKAYPKHRVIWNANVFCRTKAKIWWGDFDLTTDKRKLRKIARRLRCRLYVLGEHDGRFGRESQPHRDVVKRAVWNTAEISR